MKVSAVVQYPAGAQSSTSHFIAVGWQKTNGSNTVSVDIDPDLSEDQIRDALKAAVAADSGEPLADVRLL